MNKVPGLERYPIRFGSKRLPQRMPTTLFGMAVLLLAGCAGLPEHVERQPSRTFDQPEETSLGRAMDVRTQSRSGKSGFVLLDTGRQAFTHRASLIDAAERAIDAQYYIWNADESGRALAARVLAAADRGVRVRVLLDDFGIGTKDDVLYALDTHPNVEIRLYNPLPPQMRKGIRRWLGLIAEMDRLAPRMHNKLLFVDASVAVAGGRNIGNEYFDMSETRNFRDRDVMFTGAIIPRAGASFDASWNSEGAYPIKSVSSIRLDESEANAVLSRLREHARTGPAPLPAPASRDAALAAIAQAFEAATWAPAELHFNQPPTHDEPPSFDKPGDIAVALLDLISDTQDSLLIESGYLISGETALETYAGLRARGVQVRALTNSLASNDVVPLHAGYTRSRRQVIERGVELHELRADAASCERLVGDPTRCAPKARLALHAKSMVFDNRIVYVGSFNLNPRSAFLNTETAVVVHSPELAARISRDIEENLAPENSWRVEQTDDGGLVWKGRTNGRPVSLYGEPESGLSLRIKSFLFSLLPFEKYL